MPTGANFTTQLQAFRSAADKGASRLQPIDVGVMLPLPPKNVSMNCLLSCLLRLVAFLALFESFVHFDRQTESNVYVFGAGQIYGDVLVKAVNYKTDSQLQQKQWTEHWWTEVNKSNW